MPEFRVSTLFKACRGSPISRTVPYHSHCSQVICALFRKLLGIGGVPLVKVREIFLRRQWWLICLIIYVQKRFMTLSYTKIAMQNYPFFSARGLQTTSFLWLFQLDDSKSLHKKWLFHQTLRNSCLGYQVHVNTEKQTKFWIFHGWAEPLFSCLLNLEGWKTEGWFIHQDMKCILNQ